jgi:adenylosuccinate lyase
VGKRAAMWAADLISDLEALEFQLKGLKFFGCKGVTGTGASFLELFGGDEGNIGSWKR